MKNKAKKIISALLTLCMLTFFIPANVFAANSADHMNYVALGDSITTGYGLADKSSLYVNKLADKENCSVDNYAIDGMNSEMMLNSLQKQDIYFKAFSDQYTKVYITTSIANADIITLSIGGNDLLGPFIEALKNAMGKIPTTDMQTGLAALLSDTEAMTQLKTSMTAGVTSFITNFPQIIAALKAINPNAKIVIQTIYNPFDNAANILKMSDDQKLIFAGLNETLEAALTSMNDLIKQGATITQGPVTVTNYLVADVYYAFKANNAGGGSLLTNIANNDIHPNASGHDVIYTANYTALAPTGLTASAPTTWLNNNGIIAGVTAEMEYRLSSKSAYIAVTGTTITGLAAGTYCVRYAAKTGSDSGLDAVVTVPASSGYVNMGIIFIWLSQILRGPAFN